MQMISIGLLAEMITAYRGRDEDNYSIAEETGGSVQWAVSEKPPEQDAADRVRATPDT
jgi:hypothetical protein